MPLPPPSQRPSVVYRAAVGTAGALLPLVARFRGKLAGAVRGRVGLADRLGRWAAASRDDRQPLLWMHAPSVGEGLQAEVVLRRIREAHPDWQIAYTHFSPSAEPLAARLPADVTDFLPWDRPRDVAAALDALRPSALVFSKLDLWPELATAAAARGVAVGIIAGTVSPLSGRLRWPARVLLRPGYEVVRAAGAVSGDDAEGLARLGVPRRHIEITGDPRFDSALDRARTLTADPVLEAFVAGGPTLVAGSTWPEDEALLLRAWRRIREVRSDARLLLVPHEPSADHLAALDRSAVAAGLAVPARASAGPATEPFIVVDRVGLLAALYRGAALAYVGGGFGTSGLHSVLEPAACGVPVLFGPRWRGSRDAGNLLTRRAAAVVSPEFPDWLDVDTGATQASATPLGALWLSLLRNPEHARAAGQRGLAMIEAGLGAAALSTGLVERLVADGRQRPTTTPS